jgi:hypothetical protein
MERERWKEDEKEREEKEGGVMMIFIRIQSDSRECTRLVERHQEPYGM